MSQTYAPAKKALGNCDRCGWTYKLRELKDEVVDLNSTGLLVCPTCFDPDQPQLQVGRWPVDDPQALRNARPMGATGGRDIPYAYRENFDTGTGGWYVYNGSLTWNQSSETATLVSDLAASNPGDPYMLKTGLSIDASKYKYVRVMFKVNRFPNFEPDDRYPYDFQGQLFWHTDYPVGDRHQVASPLPVFGNSQIGSWHKLTWDLRNGANAHAWKDTITQIRFDLFDARNSEGIAPDYDSGEVEIDWVSVDEF